MFYRDKNMKLPEKLILNGRFIFIFYVLGIILSALQILLTGEAIIPSFLNEQKVSLMEWL